MRKNRVGKSVVKRWNAATWKKWSQSDPQNKKVDLNQIHFLLEAVPNDPMSSLREYDRKTCLKQLWQASHQYLHEGIQCSCYTRPTESHWTVPYESMTTNLSTQEVLWSMRWVWDQWWVPKSMKSPMIAHTLVQCFGHQWTTCCDGWVGPAWKAAADIMAATHI